MKIYTCKDRLEDIMTCIYDAWADALLIGHDQIRLKKEPIFQATLLDEYTHPFQQKKTHCRQSIIFYELDLQ